MEILKQPLITEKVSAGNEKGVYGFIVEMVSVRTMRYAAKHKTRYTSNRVVSGFTNSYKKAIVQVADGEVIDFYGEL